MITFFCPNCWSEVDETERICPHHCCTDITRLREDHDYIAKLIAALSHPEPTTPVRATWILGKLRAKAAVGPLLSLIRPNADPFQQVAAVEAFGRIGDASTRIVSAELAEKGSFLLRGKAAEALQLLDLDREG